MKNLIFDHARPEDIDNIMKIENTSFTPEEASSRQSMIERIEQIPENFLVVRDLDKERCAVAMVVGPTSTQRYISDDMFEHTTKNQPENTVQLITDLAVLPEYQNYGIATELLHRLMAQSRENGRKLISLTCVKDLIPYYEHHGFVNEGISDSKLAGETWYNMTYEL